MNDIDRLDREIKELKEQIEQLKQEHRVVYIPVPYHPPVTINPYEPYRYTWCSNGSTDNITSTM